MMVTVWFLVLIHAHGVATIPAPYRTLDSCETQAQRVRVVTEPFNSGFPYTRAICVKSEVRE